MTSNYSNILNAFAGSVWAIDEAKLNEIVTFCNELSAETIIDRQNDQGDQKVADSLLEQAGVVVDGSTAVVPIQGTILKRSNLLTRFSGGTSTELLTKAVRKLEATDSIETVVFDIDSPGGQVGGLAEAAEAIRSLRTTKRTISVANGQMASAAYWLGSAADTIVGTRDALVGNIGTMLVHEDRSEQFEKEGRNFTIFRSTPLKGAGHPSEELSDEAKAEYNKILTALNDEFIRNIALNRNISLEEAQDMADAKTHVGEDAVEEGFMDDVKTLNDVKSEIDTEAKLEDQLIAYQAAYTELVEAHDEAQTIIAGLNHELEKTAEAALAEKVEVKVRELTEGPDARFAPAQADTLRERLTEDFEGTLKTIELVPTGAAAPADGLPELDTEVTDTQTEVEKALEAGFKVAQSAEQKGVYEDFGLVEGEDFVFITE